MKAKWLQREMTAATRNKMLAALDECESRSPGQVAAITGDAERSAYAKLVRLVDAGLVTREAWPQPDVGGIIYRYRKLPPEIEGIPLYDAQPGWNILELARCFNWYTFRKRAIIHLVV